MKTNSKQFLTLQAKWDKKLKDSGFVDAEQRDGNLKRWALDHHRFSKDRDAAKEEYYRIAGHFLYEHKFEYPYERAIWELHSSGISIRNIVSSLRYPRTKESQVYTRHKVAETIQKLAKIMVEEWKAKLL